MFWGRMWLCSMSVGFTELVDSHLYDIDTAQISH